MRLLVAGKVIRQEENAKPVEYGEDSLKWEGGELLNCLQVWEETKGAIEISYCIKLGAPQLIRDLGVEIRVPVEWKSKRGASFHFRTEPQETERLCIQLGSGALHLSVTESALASLRVVDYWGLRAYQLRISRKEMLNQGKNKQESKMSILIE